MIKFKTKTFDLNDEDVLWEKFMHFMRSIVPYDKEQINELTEMQKTAAIAYIYSAEVMGEGHIGFVDLFSEYISLSDVADALKKLAVSEKYVKILEEMPLNYTPISDIADNCSSEEEFGLEMDKMDEIYDVFDDSFYEYGDDEIIDRIIDYVRENDKEFFEYVWKKVIVIGSPGAGKSTFSRSLRDKTGLPLYYLDQIWHKADKTNVSREEFDIKLDEILRKDEWIIDGNYSRTLEKRLRECDTVFLLDLPLQVCFESAKTRVGQKREEMPWVEEEFDEEFGQYILDFPNDKLPEIYRLIEQYRAGKNIFVFKSRDEVNEYIDTLSI